MPARIVQEVDMGLIFFCFMGLTAGIDLVRQEIPGWIFWLFGVAGIVGAFITVSGCENMLMACGGIVGSMSVGGSLILVSRLVRGAVGEGDGIFFLVTGLYTSWKMNLALLCYGLLLCSLYGMILMLWGRYRGVSYRKKKVPFLPFVWMAGMLMLAGCEWEVRCRL